MLNKLYATMEESIWIDGIPVLASPLGMPPEAVYYRFAG